MRMTKESRRKNGWDINESGENRREEAACSRRRKSAREKDDVRVRVRKEREKIAERRTAREEREKSPGRDLLSTICRRVSHPCVVPLSPVLSAIRKNPYLPLWRTCSTPCHRSSSQRRCCDKMCRCSSRNSSAAKRDKRVHPRARDSLGEEERARFLFFSLSLPPERVVALAPLSRYR